MKSSAHQTGFTFIESMVIAAIIAILAAVAIPNYISYVNSQKQETVSNLAETAAASADVFYRKTMSNTIGIPDLGLHYDSTRYNLSINNTNGTVSVIMKNESQFNKTTSFK